jgi:probable HAF family extracellular repeat protein
MNRIRYTSAGLCVLAVLLVLAGPLVAAPPSYVFQDLGVPPNCDSSQAYALTNAGQVAGFGTQAYPLPIYDRAFLKNYGQPMQDLGTLGGNFAVAEGVNNAGQVVGWSELDPDSQKEHAFLKNPGQPMQDLGTLGGAKSRAYGLNDDGQVVGSTQGTLFSSHAFSKKPGQPMEDLGTLGGNVSEARGINDTGQIVGFSQISSGWYHAFLKNPDQTMVGLGTMTGGTTSRAEAINGAGQIVGSGDIAPGLNRGFLKNPGEPMQALPILDKFHNTGAESINQTGQIVGAANLAANPLQLHAVLWDHGVMYDLNDVTVNLPPGIVLENAYGINDRGWIVGQASNYHAYLLIPGGGAFPATQLLLLD